MGSRERPWRGRKHIGFCSLTAPRGRLSWPARSAGLLALCLAWPSEWGASGWSPSTAHSYLQALQRKTNDSLGTVDLIVVLVLNCVNSLDCPERLQWADGVRAALAAPLAPWVNVLGSFTCVCCNLSFPRKRNKYPNSSFTKTEFCCKRKMLS